MRQSVDESLPSVKNNLYLIGLYTTSQTRRVWHNQIEALRGSGTAGSHTSNKQRADAEQGKMEAEALRAYAPTSACASLRKD